MNRKKSRHGELRDQMLDTAAELFIKNGYDGTTVQQVIDHLEVSKGAFYHYFSSKEDLLDAVADRMTRDGLAKFRPILEDQTVPALERFVGYLILSRQQRLSQMSLIGAMLKMLHRDENTIIRQKINRRTVEAVQPLFEKLIADGVAEGVFHTPDPSEAAAFMLQMGNVYAETTVPLMLASDGASNSLETIERRILFYLDAYERILGIEQNTLPRIDKDRIERIVNLIQSQQGLRTNPKKEH